ncbi:MAG: transporter permease [Actinomycetia bacterium]|nr:transporter permease [Actinomycetes bacterium]
MDVTTPGAGIETLVGDVADTLLDTRSRPVSASPSDRPSTSRIRRLGSVGFWLATAWLVLLAFVAVFANVLPLHPYDRFVDSLPPRASMGFRLSEPLGTDASGRSMLSRLVFGARESLLIGVASVGISLVIGSLIGLAAGYLRGRVDEVVTILLDTILAFPALVLLLAIASVGARSVNTVIAGLAILGISPFARLVRSTTLTLADREFVLAARTLGATRRRIMFREILPNVVPGIISVVFLFMAAVIVAEGSLSFLGLGVPPPVPSWGGMVNEGRQWMSTAPQLVFIPAGALLLTVLSLRTVGERIRVRFVGGVSTL